MSEDQTLLSSTPIPESVLSQLRERRLAGIGAYVFAAFMIFVGAGAGLLISRPKPLLMLIYWSFAVLLGVSGYLLRHRDRGKPEWIAFSIFAALFHCILLISIFLFISSL